MIAEDPSLPPSWARPLRVALYSGLLVRHDAISGSLGLKLEVLADWRRRGLPVEFIGFVQHADVVRPDVVVAPTAARALAHPGFSSADLHLFEFGIHYDLFDLVYLVPPSARRLAVYHNITPIELIEDPTVRMAVVRSFRQKANLDVVEHIACDSEFNRDDLLEFGLPSDRLSVMHLPPAVMPDARPHRRDSARSTIELLFVGRFVRSKGLLDLLEAVESLTAHGGPDFRLTLAGNQSFSDELVLAAVHDAASRHPRQVRFVGEPDDRHLADLMAASDVLVLPSYHEGYCIPVIEAYAHGCQVVTYTAGNLPNVVGDLGLLVETGDRAALADAVRGQIRSIHRARDGGPAVVPTTRGQVPREAWHLRVRAHLRAYSREEYERVLRCLLVDQALEVGGVPAEVIDALADG